MEYFMMQTDLYIKEIGTMIKKRAMEIKLFRIIILFMKETGKMIKCMEKEYYITVIKINIKENLLMD
jgi:hypothetical protein